MTRSRRQFEQSLTAPDADDPDPVLIEAIDDAEGRVDDLAQLDEPELRDHAAALGEVGEPFEVREDLAQQALTNLGGLLAGVPGTDRLEVRDSGGGETDTHGPARLLESEALLDVSEVEFAPLLQVDDALDHGAQEGALLGLGLVLRERLYDGDAPTATGEQHRPVGLIDLVHHPAGIGLEVAERNDVLRELRCAAQVEPPT
mgnify:CR=1 FL=1